eukprot:COSAG01_NODE_46251_length_401_cov_6.864238_2_plen_50_part_01
MPRYLPVLVLNTYETRAHARNTRFPPVSPDVSVSPRARRGGSDKARTNVA